MPGAFMGQMTQESAPRGLGRGIGADQQFLPIGDVGEARPDLLAVDDEFIALDAAAGAQAAKIGAGAGLREALAPDDVAGENLRQMRTPSVPACRRRSGRPGMIQADERGVERRGRAGPRVFLEPDDLLEHRQAAAADFLRPGDSRPTALRLRLLPRQHIVARSGAVLGRRARWARWPRARRAPRAGTWTIEVS